MTFVLFASAACGNAPVVTLAGSGASTAEAVPGGVAGGNTVKVCADVKRINTTTAAKLTATLKAPFDAAMAGEASEEELATAFEKAAKKMVATGGKWIKKLEAQSAAATDPALSKAVAEMATALKPLTTGRGSLQTMNEAVQKSESDLAPFCGGAPVATGSASPAAEVAAGVGPETACPAPAAFDTAEKWKPIKKVPAVLLPSGLTRLCDINRKLAGFMSYIRVWSMQDAGPKAALKAVANAFGKPTAVKYRFVTAGGKKAIEVTYTHDSILSAVDESPGRAFAVKTPSGEVLVVSWEGFTEEHYKLGLSAYNLARFSLTFP